MNYLAKYKFNLINLISRKLFAGRLSYAHIKAFIGNNSRKKFFNLLCTYWSKWRGNTLTKSFPYILILEVTNICNLKCPFCLTGKGISGGRDVRHMTFEEAKSVIDSVSDYLYLLQLYTWGEPLLNKDIYKIISYAKSKNVYVMLSTNGTVMNQSNNTKLLNSGIDYITVAIDGGSSESYRKYRVGGDFDKVMANVSDMLEQRKALKAREPFMEWQFLVFRHTEDEVEPTKRKAYEIGFDKFTPLPAYVEDEEWQPIGKKYQQQIYNPERLTKCSRPWTHLNIRADGGVASCCYEFEKKDDFGNARAQHFLDVWNNSLFQESRHLISQFNKGEELSESDLICYNCLKSGVRPSYVDKDEASGKKNAKGHSRE